MSNLEIKNLTLSQIRELKNLTQSDVQKYLNLKSDRTFRLKEQTKNEFTLSEARKLSELYKLTLDDFIQIVDNTAKFYSLKESK
jgi:uncharacterized phage protein (TIGR02220 family)